MATSSIHCESALWTSITNRLWNVYFLFSFHFTPFFISFLGGKQCLVVHILIWQLTQISDCDMEEKKQKKKQTRWDLNVTEDPCIQLWTWKPEASISGLRFWVCLRCHHRLSTDGFIYLTWQATSKAGCRVKVRERQDRSTKRRSHNCLSSLHFSTALKIKDQH